MHMFSLTLTITPAKILKDPAKTVRGVACTRFDTFGYGQRDRRTGKTICFPTLTGETYIYIYNAAMKNCCHKVWREGERNLNLNSSDW